jgi:hypothetical protein
MVIVVDDKRDRLSEGLARYLSGTKLVRGSALTHEDLENIDVDGNYAQSIIGATEKRRDGSGRDAVGVAA